MKNIIHFEAFYQKKKCRTHPTKYFRNDKPNVSVKISQKIKKQISILETEGKRCFLNCLITKAAIQNLENV